MITFPHKSFRRGQASLEYLLIFAVVAAVVISSLQTLIPRIQGSAKDYFDTGSRAIMGSNNENPNPINGAWCPWKPCACGQQSRYRACECPSPAFGGNFCPGGMAAGVSVCPPDPSCPGGNPGNCVSDPATCTAPEPPCESTSVGVDNCGRTCPKVGPRCTYTDLNPPTCTNDTQCTFPRVVYNWYASPQGCTAMYWDTSSSRCIDGNCLLGTAGYLIDNCPIGQMCDLSNPSQDTPPACIPNPQCQSATNPSGLCGASARGPCPVCCGNGRMDAGEECDPPDGIDCSPTCQFISCHLGTNKSSFGYCGGACGAVPNCPPNERCYTYSDASSACTEAQKTLCMVESPNCDSCTLPCAQHGPLCFPCIPTCYDRVQDGDETGVDCGGSCGITCPTLCGNGMLDPGESCDDGPNNGVFPDPCTATCTWRPNVCGNGIVEAIMGEQCDHGANNGKLGDTCSSLCTIVPPTCGNGITDAGEVCDGNVKQCGVILGNPPCYRQCLPDCSGWGTCGGACALTCGNGTVEVWEECDDGNRNNYDKCSNTCRIQCPSFSYLVPNCNGWTGFPRTNPPTTSSVPCPSNCAGGPLTATCQADGTYTGVSGSCTATSCPALLKGWGDCYVWVNGSVGQTVSQDCPGDWCAGGPVKATCNAGGTWSGITGDCTAIRCPPLTVPGTIPACTVPLGEGNFGTVSQQPCPDGCVGGWAGTNTVVAYCQVGGGWGYVSSGCGPAAGACPATTITNNGCTLSAPFGSSNQWVNCTGTGCSGSVTVSCISGAWAVTYGTCQMSCPATTLTNNGCSIDVPAGAGSQTGTCTGTGCSGSVGVSCNSGSWSITSGSCQSTCPAVSKIWGSSPCWLSYSISGGSVGTTTAIPCAVGCSGTREAVCSAGGSWTLNDNCTADACPALNVTSNGCTLSLAAGSGTQTVACTGTGCSGSGTGTCVTGNWSVTSTCSTTSNNCPASSYTGSCGTVTFSATANGGNATANCPSPCSGTITATCTNGNFTNITSGCTGGGGGGGCFVAGTRVLLADGKEVAIESVKVGDRLLGSGGAVNKVEKLFVLPRKDWTVYAFNGGKSFVTDTHPFMTKQGWKSLNPEGTKLENPQLNVTLLKVGDELVTRDGTVKIETITPTVVKDSVVYNFKLDGTEDYYADGFLVHNPVYKY